MKGRYAPFFFVFVGADTIVSFIDTNMSPTFNVTPMVNDMDNVKSGELDLIVLSTTDMKRSLHVFILRHLMEYLISHVITNILPLLLSSGSWSAVLKRNEICR